MSFLAGTITCLRFRVAGKKPLIFGQDHLDLLAKFQSGRQKIVSSDGIEFGWTAGDHIHDVAFTAEKNIWVDHLAFELCIVTDKLPMDRLKAYMQVELKAMAKGNPSGLPSSRQRKEAKEIARERLVQEAKDGRYKKWKCVPVLWDSRSNIVYFGSTSLPAIDRLVSLFQQTFGCGLDVRTAGIDAQAYDQRVGGLTCSSFWNEDKEIDLAWIADETSRDFLGDEFLIWLWGHSERISDTIKLHDGTELTFMLARRLTLECPRGQTGHELITHDGPTRLPEAKRALLAGKMPRRCGLTMVRHSEQFELQLDPELMAVTGLKLPHPGEDVTGVRARLEARLEKLRDCYDGLDRLFETFLNERASPLWTRQTLPAIREWIEKRERSV